METVHTDSADPDRIHLRAETSDGEMEEQSEWFDPGRVEKEEASTEEGLLHLHPAIPHLLLFLCPLLNVAATPPDLPPPAADPLTRVRCIPHLSLSTRTMNQTHPKCIPENARGLKPHQTLQESGSVGEGELLVGAEGVLLWSLRMLQSAKEALENRNSVMQQQQ